ncbi:hypothetical protein [Salisediminibacterium beveridgei]|uniref:Uncharacterized protein n=1 Tax=Salisediminibacterium beveridgei TaxID=632773 RepID=A0A1D7QZ32_9BACI|nr:hypothetical protein [Salisediminibacterium beveridgei]AOM84277.1 hypothetical protein BBEV_2952 [Salisediminibacterium beveridgei]
MSIRFRKYLIPAGVLVGLLTGFYTGNVREGIFIGIGLGLMAWGVTSKKDQ